MFALVDGKDGEAVVGEQFEQTENVFDEGISSSGPFHYILRPVSDPFHEMTMLEFYTRMIKTRKSQTAQNRLSHITQKCFI